MQFMLDVISIRSTSPLYGKVSRGIHKYTSKIYVTLYNFYKTSPETTLFGQ